MFAYLSKKISISKNPNSKVHAISWHTETGWISIGGDQGLLKIIKLDDSRVGKDKNKGEN